ncbi:MAG: signal peptidase I [Nitrososphaerota archaeon]
MVVIQMRIKVAMALEIIVGVVLLTLIALTLLDYITLAVVEGTSMEPTLQSGDLVIVIKRVSTKDISVGDVIVYRRSGTLIIHRVLRVEDDTLITKGDNNWLPDPPIRFQAVIGKVLELGGNVVKVPLVGYLTLFARYSMTSFMNLPALVSLLTVLM